MLHTPDQSALLDTYRLLLLPLARLAVSRGLPYARLDDMLRSAMVDAARELQANAGSHGEGVGRVEPLTAPRCPRRAAGPLARSSPAG